MLEAPPVQIVGVDAVTVLCVGGAITVYNRLPLPDGHVAVMQPVLVVTVSRLCVWK